MKRYCIFLLSFYLKASVCDDLPCAVRQTEYGAVCVCNSTYCDTVERPPPLPRGRYYRYTTDSVNPGFHRTTGQFMSSKSDDHVVNNSMIFTVNPSVQYQEILGFGGSFTDSAGIAVDSLPIEAQTKFIESYFGSNGIEYTMGRVTVGMSDFSPRYYTYATESNDKEMTYFSLADEDYMYKIPLIQRAMAASPHKLKLVGCAFTSPMWMKTSKGPAAGYISQDYLHAWAKYHTKFLDGYANHSIPFWALTGGNEVFVMYLFARFLTLELTAMPHDHMVWLRDHLAPQLAASNHSDVKFLILDDMRPYAKFWMSRFENTLQFARDPEAYKLVEGVALHWYFDWFTNVSLADDLHQTFPDKLIMYTESSINSLFGGEPVELGSWKRAVMYAYNIIENLNHWTSGYLDWNLALNVDGGPCLIYPVDAPIIVNASRGEFYKNPMFYTIGHFSKFIPPGSKRIDVKSEVDPIQIQQLPKSTFNKEVVALLLRTKYYDAPEKTKNHSTSAFPDTTTKLKNPFPIPTPQAVSCLATLNSDNRSSVIIINGLDIDLNVTIEDTVSGYITATLTANSINTFVYWLSNS